MKRNLSCRLDCPEDYDIEVWESLSEDLKYELLEELAASKNQTENSKNSPRLENKSLDKLLSNKVPRLFESSSSVRNEEESGIPLESFTDSEFPPGPGCVDGRRVAESESQLCCCSAEARLRFVQKEGFNHGRPFYCCATKKCDYFTWADNAAHSKKSKDMIWNRMRIQDGWCLVIKQQGFRAEDVLQGAVGDCWFLSALAVISERTDLIERVIPTQDFREDGASSFMFFLDGRWTNIVVDNYLPFLISKSSKLELVYSKSSRNQLWVPLLEKAYAKAHGSYNAISGGFISEGLVDLTGAPTETICFFSNFFDSEETWLKLQSFHTAGFPMGCSTDVTGEGIVGGHAYSILEVREIGQAKLGHQPTLRAFFNSASVSSQNLGCYPETHLNCQLMEDTSKEYLSDNETLRLIRIRNPWGKREWTGIMSKTSERWTTKLKNELNIGSKNDGTFWMMYHDFLRRFSSIDICKSFPGTAWVTAVGTGKIGTGISSKTNFELTLQSTTWLFIYSVQSTKRGRHKNSQDRGYWYTDINIIVTESTSGQIIDASFSGRRRDTVPIELHLEAGKYIIHVVHFWPNVQLSTNNYSATGEYRLLVYCSNSQIRLNTVDNKQEAYTKVLHKCILNAIDFSDISASNKKSKLANINRSRYFKYSFMEEDVSKFAICVNENDSPPALHVLHGVGTVLICLVNAVASEVRVDFTIGHSELCKFVSPYIVPAPVSSNAQILTSFTVIVSEYSYVLVAAIFETLYQVETGRTIDIYVPKFSYCFKNRDDNVDKDILNQNTTDITDLTGDDPVVEMKTESKIGEKLSSRILEKASCFENCDKQEFSIPIHFRSHLIFDAV